MVSDASWVAGMPELYATHLGPALFEPFAPVVALRAQETSPTRVLEVAAGTGIATAALVGRLPQAHIVATDLNEAMVSWAADRVPGAAWSVADAQSLDFSDRSFDLVVCQFGVMFLPDKPAAFAEVARVLEPGGRFLFTVWDSVGLSPFPAALTTSVGEMFPEDPPDFVTRLPHGYADETRVRADLAAGGLRVESVDRVVLPGSAPSARSLALGFGLGTPLRFELLRRGSLETTVDALAERMTTILGEGPVTGDLAALVVSARAD